MDKPQKYNAEWKKDNCRKFSKYYTVSVKFNFL